MLSRVGWQAHTVSRRGYHLVEGQFNFIEELRKEACEVPRELFPDGLYMNEVHRCVGRDCVHRLHQLSLPSELATTGDVAGAGHLVRSLLERQYVFGVLAQLIIHTHTAEDHEPSVEEGDLEDGILRHSLPVSVALYSNPSRLMYLIVSFLEHLLRVRQEPERSEVR